MLVCVFLLPAGSPLYNIIWFCTFEFDNLGNYSEPKAVQGQVENATARLCVKSPESGTSFTQRLCTPALSLSYKIYHPIHEILHQMVGGSIKDTNATISWETVCATHVNSLLIFNFIFKFPFEILSVATPQNT